MNLSRFFKRWFRKSKLIFLFGSLTAVSLTNSACSYATNYQTTFELTNLVDTMLLRREIVKKQFDAIELIYEGFDNTSTFEIFAPIYENHEFIDEQTLINDVLTTSLYKSTPGNYWNNLFSFQQQKELSEQAYLLREYQAVIYKSWSPRRNKQVVIEQNELDKILIDQTTTKIASILQNVGQNWLDANDDLNVNVETKLWVSEFLKNDVQDFFYFTPKSSIYHGIHELTMFLVGYLFSAYNQQFYDNGDFVGSNNSIIDYAFPSTSGTNQAKDYFAKVGDQNLLLHSNQKTYVTFAIAPNLGNDLKKAVLRAINYIDKIVGNSVGIRFGVYESEFLLNVTNYSLYSPINFWSTVSYDRNLGSNFSLAAEQMNETEENEAFVLNTIKQSGEIIRSHIRFNQKWTDAEAPYFDSKVRLAIHELGHTIGLNDLGFDVELDESLMSYNYMYQLRDEQRGDNYNRFSRKDLSNIGEVYRLLGKEIYI